MAWSDTRVDFATMQRGERVPPFVLCVDADAVRAYLDATGEAREGLWEQCVPPLALGALALGGLMDRVQVPGGLVHTGQEYQFRGLVPIGAPVEVQISVAARSERRGAVITIFETELRLDGEVVGTGRTNVMMAADGDLPL
ncbi:MAG: hypothetical protein GEU80_02375 [Dehalococcoidia bacterium]|nr:hypothetical protein [Dehalococcoidia bacterium]